MRVLYVYISLSTEQTRYHRAPSLRATTVRWRYWPGQARRRAIDRQSPPGAGGAASPSARFNFHSRRLRTPPISGPLEVEPSSATRRVMIIHNAPAKNEDISLRSLYSPKIPRGGFPFSLLSSRADSARRWPTNSARRFAIFHNSPSIPRDAGRSQMNYNNGKLRFLEKAQ